MAELRFRGGINQLDDELVNDEECVEGENFLLDAESGQFRPRPGFALMGTAPNAGRVRSIMQLVNRSSVLTTLIKAGTILYNWNGASTWTPVATLSTNSLLRDAYWSLDDLLIITDLAKETVVKAWNGTTVTDLPHSIAGVTSLYAKYSIVWQNRVWLLNIKTDSTDNPHVILASEFNEYDNYDNALTPTSTTLTANVPFFLTIPNLRPINGVATFFDTVVISTVGGGLFKITGNDATDYRIDEFYPGSGAAGEESIVNTGNDIVYVRLGGHIEKISSADTYGDTLAFELTRWIREEVRFCNAWIIVYDQAHQRVLFFKSGKILALDKYSMEIQNELSPWMKWTTQMDSALDVDAAKYVKIPGSVSQYTVYFGGPSGQVYDANGSDAEDAGDTLIKAYRKSKLISGFTDDDYLSGRVIYRRKGACTLTMDFEWSDNYADSLCQVPLLGPIVSLGTNFWGGDLYWNDTNYWNAGGVTEFRVSSAGFSAVGKAPSFFVTLSINSTVDFLVNKIETEG